ncbi:MAG: PHP domain-containing protein [Gemmatimonadota bacterium]|nr:PHP domain-containing protein [Gemmatimonadota bacterium]
MTASGGTEGLGSQDLHVHTDMSDGDLPLERVIQLAAERGVMIGIADHVSSRNATRFVSTGERLRQYLAVLEDPPVFRAGEFCWCDPFGIDLPAEVAASFDYRIGSNHGFALPDGSMASPWWTTLPEPWAKRPQELMEILTRNLCDMVRSMPIQIAAHSTLLPPALLRLEEDVHAWWTEEREDRYVEALRESGVALEISNRYRLPHDRLLRKAREAGARFALGSDGHTEAQVGRLDWAVETARRAGISAGDLFVAERKRSPRSISRTGGGRGMEREREPEERAAPTEGWDRKGSLDAEAPEADGAEGKDGRAPRDPTSIRAEDTEPYVALQYVARLFKIVAMVVVVALTAEIVAGVWLEGAGALLGLTFEVVRGIVLAAILWGAGDLTLLLIDVGHDVRAARVLLGRLTARDAGDFPEHKERREER